MTALEVSEMIKNDFRTNEVEIIFNDNRKFHLRKLKKTVKISATNRKLRQKQKK